MILYYISMILGLNFHYIQKRYGVRNQQDGVDYYAEVHESRLNNIIHTIFMPFTAYGALVWAPCVLIPSFVTGHTEYRNIFRVMYFLFLTHHYYSFNAKIATYVAIYYSNSLLYSLNNDNLAYGLAVMVSALLCQETLGHWLGGDPPSRLNVSAVSNAIVYAPYFAVYHLF